MKSSKRRNKWINKLIICLFIILLIFISIEIDLLGIINDVKESYILNSEIVEEKEENLTSVAISEKINIDNSKLNIIFFDVGQADSQLIICNDKTLLIDAGNSDDGTKIVNGLKELGVEKLDYVVGTHAHEDHIGGMSYIVDSFEIGKFLLPYNKTTTFSFYKRLLNSLNNNNLPATQVNINDRFNLGDAEFEILSVDNNEPENINESSIVIELKYGNLKYLFMSDAEIINEEAREWEDIDVLKVGHHGSNSSTSQKFLNQTLPEISIISVGKDNEYDFPKENVVNRIKDIGSTIYRTDEDGTIQIVSDGIKNDVIKIDVSFDGN